MTRSYVITIPARQQEKAMGALESLGIQPQDIDEFLEEMNGVSTCAMANELMEFVDREEIQHRMDPDPANWSLQQKKEFHRMARTHFDWTGVSIDMALAWEDQEDWNGIISQYPSLLSQEATRPWDKKEEK